MQIEGEKREEKKTHTNDDHRDLINLYSNADAESEYTHLTQTDNPNSMERRKGNVQSI